LEDFMVHTITLTATEATALMDFVAGKPVAPSNLAAFRRWGYAFEVVRNGVRRHEPTLLARAAADYLRRTRR
jgi:hypothetical protein